jgi:FkbM family methyltransferase
MMTDLWSRLKEEKRPILLYGMGNGGDKLLAVCEEKGIPVSGVFASDGFARGNLFHGMRVTSYSEAKTLFEDFTVLVAFASSREEVLENVCRIASERTLYIPELPVIGDNLFDLAFYTAHKEELEASRGLLEDERSREVFDLILRAKLKGDLDALLAGTSSPDEDFSEILHPENFRITGDFGAYTGDTALDLLKRAPGIQKIVAAEPDPKTFGKLQKNTAGLPVSPVHAAIWKEDTTLLFTASGGRGAGVGAVGKKQTEIPALRGDGLFGEDEKVDYLKFDVEGAEFEALEGCKRILSEDRPALLVSCYHRPEDLYRLPLYLKKQYPFYKLYLRRHRGFPAWDINLYAIPSK